MKTITTIFLFVLTFQLFGQFKPNSIGTCYLEKETTNEYFLTITLPYQTLVKQTTEYSAEIKTIVDSMSYTGQMILFDNEGEILKIESKEKFFLEFWCDNDGGVQYRPTLKIKIKKNSCNRALKGMKELQNICCFVLLNRNENKLETPDFKISSDIKFKGDYDNDKKIDCFIWVDLDEAKNCEGEPKNNLRIMLQVGKEYQRLRCCGP